MNSNLIRRLSFCAAACLLAGCASQNQTSWKFAVISDVRQGNPGEPGCTNGVHSDVLHTLAADVASQHVDLVIFPGDLVNGGTNYGTIQEQLKSWREAMTPLYEAGVRVYPVRGNHETHQDQLPTGGPSVWRSFFPDLPEDGPAGQEKLTYNVKHKNASFIGFDQFIGRSKTFDNRRYDDAVNSGAVSPWVIQQIKDAQTPWVFSFAHEMAFIGHHEDCLANTPKERDELWDALGAKHGIYISGHDHMYVRRQAPDSANRPVLELVVGDGGAPPYPYDHQASNANYDRHIVPTNLYVNAGGPNATAHNTDGHPMYFGYAIITVSDGKLSGEWRALINYDTTSMTFVSPAGPPKFEALDKFEWPP